MIAAEQKRSVEAFEADLEKFSRLVNVRLEIVIKSLVFKLFGRILSLTPVDTGLACATWGIYENTYPSNIVYPPEDLQKMSRQEATAKAKQNIHASFENNPNAVYWIVNNLVYIMPLEYGSSGKAPLGMVRIALAEVETYLVNAVHEASLFRN